MLRFLFAVILAAILFPTAAQAQRFHSFRNGQNVVDRWNRGMGIWHGAGRHWQTPAHDSSYYNAWSAHNSGLVSRGYYPQNMNFQVHNPQYYQADPFYSPKPPKPPKKPAAAPLGGSYEKFDDEDVDEKVPEIDPVEGEPSKSKLKLDELEDIEDQLFMSTEPIDELPNDALIYSSKNNSDSGWKTIK